MILTKIKLEWVKQLSLEPQNFVIAVVRNIDISTLLKPLLGPRVVAIQANISDFDYLPVRNLPLKCESDMLIAAGSC